MIISIHTQSAFTDYEYFKEKMDELLKDYPNVEKCLYGRSQTKEFAHLYFEGTDTICENPKLSNFKIQNLYKQIERSDLSIFFYNQEIKVGANLTGKSISRAKNLEKEHVIFSYTY